ncbi:magnesium chelatase ATPase subunit I [Salinisphaera sp. Q1T1-3]|uniref:magnesium chelatase ATPase subunit I n=1 Tax=Salinisphaera sp. Q1T1-3 TaxID=2321229 RepID=UPI000E719DF1|nr:magnesium chelatase ATPase subunit I [Salinisphaera sp. Q1T1-3]RJS92108.1 magnesium chelatase ATPase subunit I [Salinisphaera sp. Q1T1-3]
MSRAFPFSAIVGQQAMKHALEITAVDPSVGGVLVRGDRGTGKSTAVRALPGVLPPLRVISKCVYGCDPAADATVLCETCRADEAAGRRATRQQPVPVVDLPLGASEDRIVGALDLERALSSGEKVFEPGLLARAHRGYLYVDEINLLEDHLVDLLLDVAASGENIVEREGLSVRHPADFVLVGSGNPEEGELRPQLLDRFGLAVDITTPSVLSDRVEAVRRADAYRRDPAAFVARYKRKDGAVRKRIRDARQRLPSLETTDALLEAASALCLRLGTDGLRGELTLIRAARASAALAGDETITTAHLRAVAPAALAHRLRRDPLDESGSAARIERALAEQFDG